MFNHPEFFREMADFIENEKSVQEFKNLYQQVFNKQPHQSLIDLYENGLYEQEQMRDESSYEDSYDSSYDDE